MPYPKPILESAAQQFSDDTAKPPFLFDLGIDEGRKTVDGVQSGDTPRPPATIDDFTIEGGPTGTVQLRTVTPAGLTGPQPVISTQGSSSRRPSSWPSLSRQARPTRIGF